MIAFDRQQALITTIATTLAADTALAALVGRRIYDAAPAAPLTPCLTLKLVSAADVSTADTEAQTLVVDVDVWDRYALGSDLSRPRLLMGHVRRLLHLQPLTVPGCNLVVLRCTGAQGPLRDPDGVTLHGIVTVTALAGYEAVA